MIKQASSLSSFIALWSHIKKYRKKQLRILILLSIISGFLELVTVSAVIPLLQALSNPSLLDNNKYYKVIINTLNISSNSSPLVFLCLFFILSVILSSIVRLINLWANTKMAALIGSDLSQDAYFKTLMQPFQLLSQLKSSNIISYLTTHINFTIIALSSLLQIVTSISITLALISILIIVNWKVAVSITSMFAISYFSIIYFVRSKLLYNSKKGSYLSVQQVKSIQESFGSIQDIILGNKQSFYLQEFAKFDQPQRLFQANNLFLGSSPRFVLESVGIIIIVIVALILNSSLESPELIISTLGVFALSFQKLLPSLQQIYRGWASFKGYNHSILNILSLLTLPDIKRIDRESVLSFKESIELKDISFRYSSVTPYVLKKISLTIHSGERVGIVGESGSGKSTLLDLIMTLLTPSSGKVLIDGVDIFSDLSFLASIRSQIAHVPQKISLNDASIASNIAFATLEEEIDYNKVKLSADLALLSNFVESKTDGYQEIVGENGVLLSGGQKQRIVIARALYKEAKILFFDEATSALDETTERNVMDQLNKLPRNLTIILVTHRMTTLQHCDKIYKVNNGRLYGPFHNVHQL